MIRSHRLCLGSYYDYKNTTTPTNAGLSLGIVQNLTKSSILPLLSKVTAQWLGGQSLQLGLLAAAWEISDVKVCSKASLPGVSIIWLENIWCELQYGLLVWQVDIQHVLHILHW